MAAPTLTAEQERAVRHRAARLQILACAGSGKTEVLARRAVRLLLEGADPASVIAFTFTEKAASELKARIELRAAEADPAFRELPPAGRGMFVGTTHAWALEALRGLGEYETADGLTEAAEWALLHRVARRIGVVDLYAARQGSPSERVAAAPAIEAFLRSAEVVHDEPVDREVLRARAPGFARVLERYEWLLGEMRLLPFRLMIARAVDELLPGGGLRERLAGRVSHVLVDEFQDFNRQQDRLLGLLAELGAEVTVVGDDDQAIYQWRGGDVSLLVDFAARHRGERVALGRNHRCRPGIVRFARHVVEALPAAERLPKVLEAAREEAEPGAVEVATYATPEDEAGGIAARIEQLLADGHRPADVAVLYRSVRTSASPLVRALRERGIPVAVVGKTSLLARPEMALVARIFVLWAGGGGAGTWYPGPEPEPETVTREGLAEEIRRLTGADARAAARAMAGLDRLRAGVLREGVDDSVALFDEMLAVLGLPGSDEGARYRELGLGRMSELLVEFDQAVRRAAPAELYAGGAPAEQDEADEDALLAADRAAEPRRALGLTRGEVYLVRLKAFLEAFAGRAAEETPDPHGVAGDAVQVMTVHQAKGLEFPVVFVPALVERRFPSALLGRPQVWYVPDDLFDRRRYEGREEDEARLLYVALTRARELLVVSWFERHRVQRAEPSRFVANHLRPALPLALRHGQARPPVVPRTGPEELLDADFGALETYRECGYRYWLRHVCGFGPPIVPELGFGRFLHHVVAELARLAMAGRRPREEDVDAIVARDFYLPFAGPVPAANLRASAARRARAYLRGYGEELARVVRPEAPFEVPLEGARVRGRIDLLLRADGDGRRVELVDLKTAANRPPSEIHMNQLRMYALAVERQGLEPVRLWIHDLDTDRGGRIPVPHDEAERERFRERLQGWVEGIRAGRFEPAARLEVCAGCDFRRFCRYAPAEARG
ncbi:MAG TPA: ATP-dependent DNA helicase [Actinomycetota bacterium]|nr:ATP-dependent DNA helicase [Actinomycetota bacterium]